MAVNVRAGRAHEVEIQLAIIEIVLQGRLPRKKSGAYILTILIRVCRAQLLLELRKRVRARERATH